jgi:hypothetical protein
MTDQVKKNYFCVEGGFVKTLPDYKETVTLVIHDGVGPVALRCWKRDVREVVSKLRVGDRVSATGRLTARQWDGPKGEKYFPADECEALTVLGKADRVVGEDDLDAAPSGGWPTSEKKGGVDDPPF